MNGKRSRTFRLLTALLALTALAFALLLWGVLSSRDGAREGDSRTVENVPSDAADDGDAELAQRADYLPDRTRWFERYDAALTGKNGRAVSLSETRGQPTVLFFWSSWCSDCEAYLSDGFADAAAAAEAAGARFEMVCREGVREDNADAAQKALSANGIERETLMDPGAGLFAALGLNWVPSMAVLSPQGVLVYATNDMPSPSDMADLVAYAAEPAAQTAAFVRGAIQDASGAVASTYAYTSGGLVTPGGAVLSESQGLMMEHALLTGDREAFDAAYACVSSLLTDGGLCAWRRADGQNARVNATLDDLRILAALLRAQEMWGGYSSEISVRERALYSRAVRDDMIRDFVDLDTGGVAETTSLCYLDVTALRTLAEYRERWAPVADNAASLLQRGVVSEVFPLYHRLYNHTSGAYAGDSVQMSEAMVAVLNAARAGLAREDTLDYLQSLIDVAAENSKNTLDGAVAPGCEFESTAVYALLAQIGALTGRDEMVRLALQGMERQRVTAGEMAGSYGLDAGASHYVFDTLEAMAAWDAVSAIASEEPA